LHLKTSPGMQVITFVPDEIRGLLLCNTSAFEAMIGVHSSAVARKILPRLSIFIKSSVDFLDSQVTRRSGVHFAL